MGWYIDGYETHEGNLYALELDPAGAFLGLSERARELSSQDAGERAARWLRVGCSCGWRSSTFQAPHGASVHDGAVEVPRHAHAWQAAAERVFRAHAVTSPPARDGEHASVLELATHRAPARSAPLIDAIHEATREELDHARALRAGQAEELPEFDLLRYVRGLP